MLPSLKSLLPSFFVSGLAMALSANAFTVNNLGYRDNPCSASLQSAGLWYGSVITLNVTYRYTCADGSVFNQASSAAVAVNGPSTAYGPTIVSSPAPWSLTFYPQKLAYNATTNQFVFSSTSSGGRGLPVPSPRSVNDPFYTNTLINNMAGSASSATLPGSRLESWDSWQQTTNAAAAFQKYDPAEFSVSPVFNREYPAFPFDMAKTPIEDASSATPRALVKVAYAGNPDYFAMVYCFPGDGDNDMYNKPIVVGDAFDPNDNRDAQKIYSKDQFSRLLSIQGVSPRKKGYDVFFLDFAQGGGNLHVNAMIELKFIEWLSAKAGRKMIVGGPSMSGIVARLALLYSMPANNEAGVNGEGADLGRMVKGYISIDSPQQGANVPADLLTDIYDLLRSNLVLTFGPKGDLRGYRDQLNTPAAHQMLYEHYFPDHSYWEGEDFILVPPETNTSSHDAFYGFLNSKGGYRPGMPKVAIAYSNPYLTHPGYTGPYATTVNRMGTSDVYRLNRGNPYDFMPGSQGDWFYSSYQGSDESNMRPVSFGSPAEKFKGTFIPFASALDLQGFDGFSFPDLDENGFKAHSPFDAVFYMKKPYNGYCTGAGVCSKISQCEAGNCRSTIEDKRYEHIVIDDQLIASLSSALDRIESLDAAKRLPPIVALLLQ
jgi:hypothetical protein